LRNRVGIIPSEEKDQVIVRLIKFLISVVFGAYDGLIGLFGSRRPGSCVVINYHSISGETKLRFGKQLDRLSCLATPIPAGKEFILNKHQRYVAITVDDVFCGFIINGLPELCRRNIPVTLFPPTGFLNKKSSWDDYGGENKVGEEVVSAEELKLAAKFSTVDFGSHGVTHSDLTRLSEDQARQELLNSKKSLEAIVNREIIAVSFPYGSYGSRELRLANEAGYKFYFDSTPQQLLSAMSGGLIGRVDVQPTDWNMEFRLKVCGAYRWVRPVSAWKKKLQRRLVALRK
jgi:peptidoglycan/xylan/chitin deacetylase (PgdA/CDA1 family)